ncbi:MAG: hypothetical protein JNM62_03530 [Flavobacteriales bacterium]|nr:hypothetical protein [Flavobacteriales bacterium]
MKRSIKPRKVGVMPWLIGTVLMGGSLVLLFTFGKADWLRRLPLVEAGDREWNSYSALFDRAITQPDSARSTILRIGGSSRTGACVEDQLGGSWYPRWFEGVGYGDSVEVRNSLDREGFVVRFKKNAPYRDQRRIMLTPTTTGHVQAQQLVSIASELGLVTTGTSLVRVLSCGKELGTYLQTEWVDDEMLERRGISGAILVKQGFDPSRPDHQFAVIEADSAERVHLRGVIERALSEVQRGNTDMLAGLVDEKSAIAWLLMAWVDGRDLRTEPVMFAYNWSTGRFSPIYQPPARTGGRNADAPLSYNLLTPLLRRAGFKAQFAKRQAELAARLPEMRQRWNSGELQTMLAVAHVSDANAATALDRPLIAGPGHATFMNGMVMPSVAAATVEDTAMIAHLAKRYKLILQGDSVIFPRGKYMINEDIEFPSTRSVLMLQGARVFLGPGRSLVCKGDLYIRGTMRNPVFIRPQEDGAPFGTVAVLGSGTQQCAISGLYVSGGAGAKVAGNKCGGMVTVQGVARTLLNSTVFQENRADASLLINGGEVEMREVRFEDAAQQFVQLEHVNGVLRDVTMVGARTNTTDGLRIGTGTVAVIRGIYTGLRGTAILADGAAQVLVHKVRLSQNATALRCEARAVLHADGNTLEGNDLVFSTPSTGTSARMLVYPNTLTGNKSERTAGSSIVEKTELDAVTVAPFGVQLNEPVPEVKKPRRGRASRSSSTAD